MTYKTLDDVPERIKQHILDSNGCYDPHAMPCTLEQHNRALDLMRGFPDEWPEGVEYWAQDPDGTCYPYVYKPNAVIDAWDGHVSAATPSIKGTIIGDWRTTLRKRPVSSVKSSDSVGESGEKLPSGNGNKAAKTLEAALGHMKDRAATYDSEQGERSMGKCVAMFNSLYGQSVTEEQGWAFMCLLKLVRTSQGDFRADNYEDLAAYAGLMRESADKEA